MTEARENPDRPIVGVGAVVIDGGDILLIRRGKAPKAGEWSLPGGAQKLGETTNDAVKREVFEETGLEIALHGFLDVIDFVDHSDDGEVRFHYTLIDYLATPCGGKLEAGSDAQDARFFSLEEALGLPLWSETRRIIRLAESRYDDLRKENSS